MAALQVGQPRRISKGVTGMNDVPPRYEPPIKCCPAKARSSPKSVRDGREQSQAETHQPSNGTVVQAYEYSPITK